jgi:MFS family permease
LHANSRRRSCTPSTPCDRRRRLTPYHLPMPRVGTLWRNRDFAHLWSAQSVSMVGSEVSGLALPLVAILVLHASTFAVAALGVVEFLPFVLLTLPAGVWVDRLRRRPILIAADVGRAVVLGSVPLTYAFGGLTLVQLYAVGFLTGVFTVFFDVSYQSYLPALVDKEHVIEGNAKLELSRAGSQVAGPTLAGALVSALTASYAVAVDAFSFVVSALCLMRIRKPEPEPVAFEDRQPMRAEIATGLRYTWRHPLLRPLILQIGMGNFFNASISSILLVFAVRDLHLTATTIGIAFSVGNAGLLLGATIARRLAAALGIGPTLICGAVATGVAWLLLAVAPRHAAIPLLALAQFVWSLGAVLYFVNGISLIQTITPDRLLGRVNASRRFAVWGVIPFGSLLGGALGTALGLRTAIWIGATGAALSSIPLLVSPMRHVRRTEDAEKMVRAMNDEFLVATEAS